MTSPALLCGLALISMAAVGALAVSRPGDATATSGDNAAVVATTTTTAPIPVLTVQVDPNAPTTVATTAPAPTTTTIPADTTPPVLTIAPGLEGSTVTTAQFVLSGTAEAAAVVSIGTSPALLDEKGNWAAGVELVPGVNSITVTATDPAGNVTAAVVTVNFSVPPPSTTPATTATTSPKKTTTTTKPPTTAPPATTATTRPPAPTTLPPDVEPG
ncbi:MAG: hypothetical protein AB7V43_03000 [Acidimicrobiia bacterium]